MSLQRNARRVEAMLAGAEFLQIVRRRHAGGVEEILILAQAAFARFGASPFGAMQ